MFELADERPPHWPSLEIPPRPGDELNCSQQSGYTIVPTTWQKRSEIWAPFEPQKCLLTLFFPSFLDFTELNYESDEAKEYDTDGEYEIL